MDFNDENMHIVVQNEDGEELDCEVIMYYKCLDNGIDYVFYTDNMEDENGELSFYASRFLGIDNDQIQIGDIETEEEWALLENVMQQVKSSLQ